MDSILNLYKQPKESPDFDAVKIQIASPEKIRAWSFGEVTKPETINYRTFKPERNGLFCAKIFGPTKDWECVCGKYKRMKHRGVVCDKCGVEVIQSKVRRERLGHIELACPVSHVWFFKGLPSRIGHLLDMSLRELEKILYFEMYVVLDPGPTKLKEKDFITEEECQDLKSKYGDTFEAAMGAEAIKTLLKRIDPTQLADQLRKEIKETNSLQKRKKLTKRLRVVEAFRKSGNRPEWMILDVIPVLPPELRPLVPLDGGHFATSDLNDLYRRVINRNNRLKRLQELKAPEVIIRNEKRMLQEAVDALFDNGRRGRSIKGPNNRPLRSLSDMLKGKQGRFRQNLLGKRVDYSGRSVIVIGPELKLYQCGLPKQMALELFKPFILNKLDEKGYATTIKTAKRMIELQEPVVWDILEEIIQDHPVLLNRAPTLHRLGIQAFQPVLVEGKAIKIHPLVCVAFNADFDGDQMAVHVPLSVEAQLESKILMLSSNNILSPADGTPIVAPTQDIVLGCYYLTKARNGDKGEGKIFANADEVRLAYDMKEVGLQARIFYYVEGNGEGNGKPANEQDLVKTTVGRVFFNEILPKNWTPFFNGLADKSTLKDIIARCYREFGHAETVTLLDRMKELGFEYATLAGISISLDNMHIPTKKENLILEAQKQSSDVESQYREGIITNGERYNKVVDIWSHVTERVADEMFKELIEGQSTQAEEFTRPAVGEFNPIFMMADSGARGSKQQIRQLAGMRGLMAKPSGEIIETPITANFREGLTVLEYFISTHGARKGLADTALKTADSGYLTRRLVDVAQDVIIREIDCKTLDGIIVKPIIEAGEIIEPLKDRILGRVALDDIRNPYSGEIIVKANADIDEEVAQTIEDAGIEQVKIRSVLTCESKEGVCAMCYGRNLASGRMVDLGEAVGVIAAQSIGEPGTQLTMRTFHIGGTASRKVEESKLFAKNNGSIRYQNLNTVIDKFGDNVVMNRNGLLIIVDDENRERERYQLVYGAKVKVLEGQNVKSGELLVEWDPYTLVIITEKGGKTRYVDIVEGKTMKEELDEQSGRTSRVIVESTDEKNQPRISIRDNRGREIDHYLLPTNAHLVINDGDEVASGDILAKIPRETTKTKDITGGLPRVVELFEARKPKELATISEMDGIVSFGPIEKGMRQVKVSSDDGTEKEYFIPRGKHISVHENDKVRAGEPLVDGSSNPHDILHVLGDKELQKYLVNEVQEVYRLQGVSINDKHIEVIVRQMLKQVRIDDPGDTEFLLNEQVDKFRFKEENQKVIKRGGVPAKGSPLLLGITKASLSTDSFISSASFQETTRVLTEVSISGKVDYLRGLKENVIVGRLIPAGTGMAFYKAVETKLTDEDKGESTSIESQG